MLDSNLEITLSDDKKVEVLMQALGERYNSIHIIRDRVQNICLWFLGLFITATGWIIQSDRSLEYNEKIFFSLIIAVVVFILRRFYLNDLERGFKNQQKTQVRIEDALGLCKKNIFTEEPIYPGEWLSAGLKEGKGKFFVHNYLLIYTGTLCLLLGIWLS